MNAARVGHQFRTPDIAADQRDGRSASAIFRHDEGNVGLTKQEHP